MGWVRGVCVSDTLCSCGCCPMDVQHTPNLPLPLCFAWYQVYCCCLLLHCVAMCPMLRMIHQAKLAKLRRELLEPSKGAGGGGAGEGACLIDCLCVCMNQMCVCVCVLEHMCWSILLGNLPLHYRPAHLQLCHCSPLCPPFLLGVVSCVQALTSTRLAMHASVL
jgi:hypothetical protein